MYQLRRILDIFSPQKGGHLIPVVVNFNSATAIRKKYEISSLSVKILNFHHRVGLISRHSMNPTPTVSILNSQVWLHVKIPEIFFKILEEGKNVGKFIFR